jgi:hypothetical protein
MFSGFFKKGDDLTSGAMDMDMGASSDDHLCLAGNVKVQTMLSKEGDPKGEVVMFSDFATKINRKDVKQKRCVLITQRALYNLLPDSYAMQRRIALKDIVAVTVSQRSNEFSVNVPDEYDYRYISPQRDVIVNLLKTCKDELVEKKESGSGEKMKVILVDKVDLKEETVTKPQSKELSREEKLNRKKEYMLVRTDSDAEDEADIAGNTRGSSKRYGS